MFTKLGYSYARVAQMTVPFGTLIGACHGVHELDRRPGIEFTPGCGVILNHALFGSAAGAFWPMTGVYSMYHGYQAEFRSKS
jgi:hypothetical protein